MDEQLSDATEDTGALLPTGEGPGSELFCGQGRFFPMEHSSLSASPVLSYLFRQSQPGVRQLGPWNLRKEMEWGGVA